MKLPIPIPIAKKGKAKSKEQAKKAQAKVELPWKWYKVASTPFQILSDEDQAMLTGQFTQLLNMVQEGAIYVNVKQDIYTFTKDMQLPVSYTNFYLGVKGNQEVPFFNARPTQLPARPNVKEEYPDHVVLDNGKLAKVYVAYNFPNQLPEGFLYEYYGSISELYFYWKQVPLNKAISMVNNARLRAENLASHKPTAEIQQRLAKLRELSVAIGGSTRLLEFYLYFIVEGSDDKELAENEQVIKNIASARLIDIEAPKYVQAELYQLKTTLNHFMPFNPVKNYVDTISASVFFPFINEDLIEEGGVFLGISGSNVPVVFDIFNRNNYNVVILGEPGSGKSMTVKIFLKRFRSIKEGFGLNILDPENEYVKVANVLGAKPIEVRSRQKLGLDPFVVMSSTSPNEKGLVDPVDIAELLADLYYVPQELRPRFRRFVTSYNFDSIFDMVDRMEQEKDTDESLKKLFSYFEGIRSPPDSYVYDGEPIDLEGDVIVGLRELRNARLKALVSSLVTIALQSKLFSKGRQIFAVDEGWLFAEYQSVYGLLGEVARRGRKYGDVFLFATQRPWDVYGNNEGRTILEQSATAILLRQRPTATKVLEDAFQLSRNEIDFLMIANPGQGIIRAGNYRLTIQIMPTPEELKTFTTRPTI